MEKVCIILLANFIFYAKTVKFGYVSDDIAATTRNYPSNIWHHIIWILEGKLKCVRKGKQHPDIDHAVTIMFHALVCVGIYMVFGRNDISFMAALLFSFNPINNQVSVWIAGRNYAIGALGLLYAMALPLQLSGLMLLVATYSNGAFLMPIVFITKRPDLLIFMPLVWMFSWKNFSKNFLAKAKIEVFIEDKEMKPQKLTLMVKTFGFYLSHSLLPIKNTFYHSLLESIAGSKSYRAYSFCRYFWFGLFSLCVMVLYIATHKWDMVCFGVLWWCIGIAPFLNLRRMQQEIAERYCYIPNIGLMLVLACFIHCSPFLCGGILMMYATKMWFYMNCYQSDFWIIETARINSPDSWFCWHMAAVKRFEKQSYMEAMIFWVEAKLISPKEFKILHNLAACTFLVFRNLPETIKLLDEAQKNIPKGQEKMGNAIINNFRMALKNKEVKIPILI